MTIECPKCQFDNPNDTAFCGKCGTNFDAEDAIHTKTLETPVTRLALGSIFAERYEILEKLGKGGMGEVYRVKDNKLDEEMALKIIKPEIAASKEIIERFKNELKLARKIAHKHVCKMYDLNEEEETPYITMEYVKGEDLKSFIRGKGRLTQEKAITIAKQMCEGLAGAHELGVIHRDLKPQNIMIDEKGNAKVMDFGIARSVEAPGVTVTGMMIGTPDYISPEQAEGEEADQRSDIYSLGVILYEMVTGSVPFKGDTALSVALKHKAQLPRDPRKMNPEISDDLARLILICMEKDRERRCQTAEVLLDDLRNIEEGLPLGTKIRPKRETFAAALIRRKLFIPAFVIVLVIIGIISWHPWSQKETVPLPSDRPSLVVMYFQNNTGDASLDIWEDILSRMMIADISQSRYIRVLPDDRIYGILDKLNLLEIKNYSTEDLREIATQGGSTHILRGFLTRSGDSFRINSTLQESSTMEIIDSEMVEGKGEGSLYPMVDELTMKIKESFQLSADKIAGDFDMQVGMITTPFPKAYEFYIEARKYHYLGQYSQSIHIYQKALDIDPEFALALTDMGTAYFFLGSQSKARECFQKALELSDRVSERVRYYIQGFVYMGSDKTYDKSIEAWKKLLELYPDDNDGNNNLGLVYSFIEEWDKTIEPFISCIQRKDEVIWPYLNLSVAYRAKGLYDKAKEVLEDYLNNVSDYAAIHNQLALTYLCQEKYDLALVEADKALSMDPDNYFYFLTKGDIYHCKGDLIKTEKEYQKVLELEEKAAHFYGRQKLGALYLLQGRFEESEEQLKQGILLAKDLVEKRWESSLQLDYIYRYLKSGRFKEALEESQNAQEAAVQGESLFLQISSLHYKGIANLEMKSMEEAQRTAAELKELIESGMNKKAIRYYYHLLGKIELKRENFSKAVEFFKRDISLFQYQCHRAYTQWLAPDSHALFMEPLALAYYKMGDLDKAQEEYEKITSLSSGRIYYGDIYAKSFYMLGKICEEKEWKGKAIEHYDKFLSLWKDADPGLPEIDDARKRLAGLKE